MNDRATSDGDESLNHVPIDDLLCFFFSTLALRWVELVSLIVLQRSFSNNDIITRNWILFWSAHHVFVYDARALRLLMHKLRINAQFQSVSFRWFCFLCFEFQNRFSGSEKSEYSFIPTSCISSNWGATSLNFWTFSQEWYFPKQVNRGHKLINVHRL